VTRRMVATDARQWSFCTLCGSRLIREVTVVRRPSDESWAPFEPYKKPVMKAYCVFEQTEEHKGVRR
jgi:hypothetical protein